MSSTGNFYSAVNHGHRVGATPRSVLSYDNYQGPPPTPPKINTPYDKEDDEEFGSGQDGTEYQNYYESQKYVEYGSSQAKFGKDGGDGRRRSTENEGYTSDTLDDWSDTDDLHPTENSKICEYLSSMNRRASEIGVRGDRSNKFLRSNSSSGCSDQANNLARDSSGTAATDDLFQIFSVYSMGTLPVTEDDLTDSKSGQAIQRCMVTLSTSSNVKNAVYEWPKNLELKLVLEGNMFRLINTKKGSVTLSHPLRAIRMWSVQPEPGSKLFSYVVRDQNNYICRVFKCTVAGSQIAGALRKQCRRRVQDKQTKSSAAEATANRRRSEPWLCRR